MGNSVAYGHSSMYLKHNSLVMDSLWKKFLSPQGIYQGQLWHDYGVKSHGAVGAMPAACLATLEMDKNRAKQL